MSSPGPTSRFLDAFGKVPETERLGALTVTASKVTTIELEHIRTALQNPKPKPDAVAMVASLVSVLLQLMRVLRDASKAAASAAPWTFAFDGWDIVVLLVAAGVAAVLVFRYAQQTKATHPFHDLAERQVSQLIEAYSGGPGEKPDA